MNYFDYYARNKKTILGETIQRRKPMDTVEWKPADPLEETIDINNPATALLSRAMRGTKE